MHCWLLLVLSIASISGAVPSGTNLGRSNYGGGLPNDDGITADRDSPALIENGNQDAGCAARYSYYGALRNNMWESYDQGQNLVSGHPAWYIRTDPQNSLNVTLLSTGGIVSNPRFRDYYRGLQFMFQTMNLSPAEVTLPGDEELALGYDVMAFMAEEYNPRHLMKVGLLSTPIPNLRWLASNLHRRPKESDEDPLFEKYRLQRLFCEESPDAPRFHIIVGLVEDELMRDRVPTEIYEEFEVETNYTKVLDDIKDEVYNAYCKSATLPCRLTFAVAVHDGPTINGTDLTTELSNTHSTFAKFVELMKSRGDVELIFCGHVDREVLWKYASSGSPDDKTMWIASTIYDPSDINSIKQFFLQLVGQDSIAGNVPQNWPPLMSSWLSKNSPYLNRLELRSDLAPMIEPYLAEKNCDVVNVEAAAAEPVTPHLTYDKNGTACTLCQTLADALLWAGTKYALSSEPPSVAIVSSGDMQRDVENSTREALYAAIPAFEFVVTLKVTGAELIRTLTYQYPQDKDLTKDDTLVILTTAGLKGVDNYDWLQPADPDVIDTVHLYLEDGSEIEPDSEYTIITTTNVTTRSHGRFVPLWDKDKFVTTWRPIQLMEKYLSSDQYLSLNPSWAATLKDAREAWSHRQESRLQEAVMK